MIIRSLNTSNLLFLGDPRKDEPRLEFVFNEMNGIIEYTKDLFNNDLHIVILNENGTLIRGTVNGKNYEIINEK